MFGQIDVLRMAGAMARNAEARQGAIARNVANADTPGYRAVDLPSFAESYAASDDFAMLATLPGHGKWRVAGRLQPGSWRRDGRRDCA